VLEGAVEKASFDADPKVILNAELVALARPVEAALSVYEFPDLLMLKPEKLACPETAFTVRVPASVPPPGFVPMAIVTGALDEVTVLPFAS